MEKSQLANELREHYLENLPEGYSKRTLKSMSDSDLLDMHYFLNDEEDDYDETEDSPDFFLEDLCDSCQKKLKAMMGKGKFGGR